MDVVCGDFLYNLNELFFVFIFHCIFSKDVFTLPIYLHTNLIKWQKQIILLKKKFNKRIMIKENQTQSRGQFTTQASPKDVLE